MEDFGNYSSIEEYRERRADFMIDMVKKFFGGQAPEDSGPEGDESHDIRVATCALLLEMAKIDGEFCEEEQQNLVDLLKTNFDLSDEYVRELMDASQRELDGSIDMWRFTNLINQNYSQDEKRGIIEMLWKVVYADGTLDKHEDYLVHKLGQLLRLSHKELIDAKLAVLKK